jgi:hypothetical protein
MHLWGGNWTHVRTHTPIQLSKAVSAFASHPLGWYQVSRERVTAPSEPGVPLLGHRALRSSVRLSLALVTRFA